MKMYSSAVIAKTIQACKIYINFEHTIQVLKGYTITIVDI